MSMLCVCPQFLRKQLVQRRMKKSQGWEVPGKCHCVLGLPFLTEETNRTSNLPEMILWGLNKIEPFLKKHQTVTHCYTECKLGPLSKEQVWTSVKDTERVLICLFLYRQPINSLSTTIKIFVMSSLSCAKLSYMQRFVSLFYNPWTIFFSCTLYHPD